MAHVQLEDQARSHAPPQRTGPVPRATDDLQVHLRVGQVGPGAQILHGVPPIVTTQPRARDCGTGCRRRSST
eukprot:3094362-Pyramimonas_sp.AAC.2